MVRFTGFPKEGLRFFHDLTANNDRQWFATHKQEYLDHVLDPGVAFVVSLGERLKSLSAGLSYDTRRIYRDIRFSKDKSPYNTAFRALFWEGKSKKGDSPGFFFGMDHTGARIYSGLHMFSKELLTVYREAVADEDQGSKLEKALSSVKGAGAYEVGGKHYKRVPSGYDPEHKRAELLLYNGLHALSSPIEPQVLLTGELIDACLDHCRKMLPIHEWLIGIQG
jgi:uncharacterized protein (TIGR02453 family)